MKFGIIIISRSKIIKVINLISSGIAVNYIQYNIRCGDIAAAEGLVCGHIVVSKNLIIRLYITILLRNI